MSALMSEWQARKVEETEELYKRLMVALRAGRVDLVTDARMLDHTGSPVHSPWDHLAPLLGLMILAMIILLSAGMAFGIVAMFFCAIIHLLGNRYFVAWRIQERTYLFVQYSVNHWQAVWEAGGLAIVVKGSGELPCFAPTGDWRKFVRRLIPAEGAAIQPAPAPVAEPVHQPHYEPEPEPEYAYEPAYEPEYEPEPEPEPLPPVLKPELPPTFPPQEPPPMPHPSLGPNGRLELEG